MVRSLVGMAVVGGLALGVIGCASGPDNPIPNPTMDLRRNTKQLAAAAADHKYPAEAPHAGRLPVRGEVDYQLDVINLVNLADNDMADVEVWVNGKYMVALSTLPTRRQVGVNFKALFDSEGKPAPRKGVWVEKVELFSGGNLYDVTLRAAE